MNFSDISLINWKNLITKNLFHHLMKIKEIMNTKVITIKPNQTIKEAVKKFSENNIGGLPVVDEKENVIGIISESDIFKLLEHEYSELDEKYKDPSTTIDFDLLCNLRRVHNIYKETKGTIPVFEIMQKNVITITPGDTIEHAATLMIKKRINRLPVVIKGKLVGIVTRDDIIKTLAAD